MIALLCAAALTAHPLDPLSGEEIATVARVVSAHPQFPKGALFPAIALDEPPKADVLAWTPGAPFGRKALAVVLDRAANKTYEARIDLRAGSVESWKARPGVQPLVLLEEYDTVPKIVKADARWQEAMRRRGITDFGRVWVDTWATGHFAPPASAGARLLRGVSYLQDGAVNFYGRPIEGVTAIVDMNAGKVVDLIDTGVIPISDASPQLDIKARAPLRKDLKPLVQTQPRGPSFSLRGREVRWQKWRFRHALHPREGLVLYDVRYDDGGSERRVLYRASLAEMVVPYGDADANWSWRNAFDEGEYGVGRLASPLKPGGDAPSQAVFFDADFSDDFGKPYVLRRAVGLYERERGFLWKHYDIYHDQNDVRRARELVLFFVATIGNYDYALQWIFHQDGTLQVECALSGIMLAKGVEAVSAEHAHGSAHLVAPRVAAPHHQHFFNFRVDLDIDGESNAVREWNTRAGPASPERNAIVMEETPLQSERAAQRDVSMPDARKWAVVNPSRRTSLGYHPGYLLVPGENAVPYLAPESKVRQRAPFLEHHFWVTRYHEGERYAAGEYPNQAPPGEGLGRYASNDERLEGEDVVVWYTMGVTHVPRPEEWPVMNVHRIGFSLMPAGFFVENPALDVPP